MLPNTALKPWYCRWTPLQDPSPLWWPLALIIHVVWISLVITTNVHNFAFFHIEQHFPLLGPRKSLDRSCCKHWLSSLLFTFLKIFVSSANFNNQLVIAVSRSFMKIRKRRGPRIEPWGTPLHIFVQREHTLCVLSLSQFLIHCRMRSSTPWFDNFWSSRWCRTLSNAFAKSNYTTSTLSPIINTFSHLIQKCKQVAQARPPLKICMLCIPTCCGTSL